MPVRLPQIVYTDVNIFGAAESGRIFPNCPLWGDPKSIALCTRCGNARLPLFDPAHFGSVSAQED